MDTTSYWRHGHAMPRFPQLDSDRTFDVVVIGAGMTGISAAYLLKRDGLKVALIDRGRAADMDTSHTSAHLTCVLDARLADLVATFGDDHARAAWDAGLAAIATIDEAVRRENIDCDFAWVPAYLHSPVTRAPTAADIDEVRTDVTVAERLGFDAEFVEAAPLVARPAMKVTDQARFQPRAYLRALIDQVDGGGCAVFEHTNADEVADDPLTVVTPRGRLRCADVIVATHDPIVGRASLAKATLLQSALALYTSYVAAGRVPKGSVPDALYWDTADPYTYVRIDPRRDADYVIYGGEDHKTGQEPDTRSRFTATDAAFRRLIPAVDITHHWSGQIIKTSDGLPFIGYTAPHQYAATGFVGNGLTLGTLGAMMAADAIAGRRNPWQELFDVNRSKVRHGLWDYLRENTDYPYYMIRDRFAGPDGKSTRAIPRGSGRIIERRGKPVAAFRGDDGAVVAVSAVCTHMGCRVAWNQAERTWDCPCHGSRFGVDGRVLAGPAETPLARAD